MNRIGRREFIGGTVALGACAAMGAPARRKPLLLDTKRMAIHDGPGMRTTFFVKEDKSARHDW